MSEQTREAIDRFNEAFNSQDVDRIMSHMTEDVVFENTAPPDGERFEGSDAVRAAWQGFFASSPRARFDAEDVVAAGDRCVVQWRFVFDADDPSSGHVRGVDVFRVRDGLVAEKLSCVKG